ncbi:ejaculatory bulb-specific protein 3-like [Belonocnema kinseyi]|uniref:ejaculatory bulb-specific protein 3-like n=1 Tax=Belonocnema kinseyi TaxID=2817044 RepID=UPI00143DF6A8|nr:ejaculatory bulb-specific protein 3-like [Belonocnema kinseyi]
MSGFGIFFGLVLLVTFAAAADEPTALYSNRYDFINVDEILSNERIRNQYSKCYSGTGPCLTPDAKFFKDVFPEAIGTRCKRCTEKQKQIFEKIVVYYIENDPEQWKQILTRSIQARNS